MAAPILAHMPTYEFRCRQCGETFTQVRPMSASADPAVCPKGHADTTKLLNVAGTLTSGPQLSTAAPTGGGGGCCGGGCCG